MSIIKDSCSPLIEVTEVINKIGTGISGWRGKEKTRQEILHVPNK